jgi:hypothetical protein
MSSDVLYKQTPFLYNLTYLQIYNKKRVMTPLRQQLRQTSQRSRQRSVTPCDGVHVKSLSFSRALAPFLSPSFPLSRCHHSPRHSVLAVRGQTKPGAPNTG